jgi:hypothetical protein
MLSEMYFGRVCDMYGEKRDESSIVMGKCDRNDDLEDLDVDGSIILNFM